jgi:hypothetical protein
MASIRKLAEVATAVHELKYEYEGETFDIVWMELSVGEEPSLAEVKDYDTKTDAEKNAILLDILDRTTYACIAKGMRVKHGEEYRYEEWMELPKRVRMVLADHMFQLRKAQEARFLNGRPTIQSS